MTALGVKAMKGGAKRAEKPDSGKGSVPGLYTVVQPSGAKSWVIRYRHEGRPRKLTLVDGATFNDVTLADVRKDARAKLDEIKDGRDPAGEKRQAALAEKVASTSTVGALIDEYEREHLSTIRSGKSVRRYLDRFAVAVWRDREVASISAADVRAVMATAADTPILRNRLHSYLRHWFNWCVDPRGALAVSPMAGIKRPMRREESKDRVLSDDETRWLWKACETTGHPWGPLAKFLLLSGQRLNEAAQITDAEISGDVWSLSKARTKNGRAHDVPLSVASLEVLAGVDRIKGTAGYIFTTTGASPVQGFHKGRAALHAAMNEIATKERGSPIEVPHWTFHDLRRTCATGLARLAVPVRVTEAVLNHISGTGGGIVSVYQRHDFADEKRAALDAWGKFVTTLVGPQA